MSTPHATGTEPFATIHEFATDSLTTKKPRMKIYRMIASLLLFFGAPIYAGDGPVLGYPEPGCTGEWIWAKSFSELYDYHDEYDFKSYLFVADPDVCYVFEEAIIVTGTPEPSTGTDGGGTGGGGGGGSGNSGRGGGGGPNPMEMVNDERNEELKDCWVEKLEETGELKKWEGGWDKEKWSTNTGATWGVSDENFGALGYTEASATGTTVSISVLIYPRAIFAMTQGDYQDGIEPPTMDHLTIYAQMHEYAHVLQFKHEADDGDSTYVPPPYELFDMELAANAAAHKWWWDVFGFGPPVVMSTDGPSRKHRTKTTEYKNLERELAADDELADDDPNKLSTEDRKEKEEALEDLTEWFKSPENLPTQIGVSGTYTSDPEEDIDC